MKLKRKSVSPVEYVRVINNMYFIILNILCFLYTFFYIFKFSINASQSMNT